MLDTLNQLNQQRLAELGDPEIQTRIAQYEMAFRMQNSVPELIDLKSESAETLSLYGDDVQKPGTFAASALLARRLVERGVRVVQILHRGWDQHGNIAGDLPAQCGDVDQATAALLTDLKNRGLLDSTLVVWGGGVWSNRLLPRWFDARELRPRPSSALLHDVVGRRWHQRWRIGGRNR